MLKTTVLLNSYAIIIFVQLFLNYFRIFWWLESSKEQHLQPGSYIYIWRQAQLLYFFSYWQKYTILPKVLGHPLLILEHTGVFILLNTIISSLLIINVRMPSWCDWVSTAIYSCVGMKHLSRTAAWNRSVIRRLSSCLHVWMKLPKPHSLYRPRFMPTSSPTNPRLVSVCFHVTEYEVLQNILVVFTTVVIPLKI